MLSKYSFTLCLVLVLQAAKKAEEMFSALDLIQKYFQKIDTRRYVDSILNKKRTLRKSADNWWNDELESKVRDVLDDDDIDIYELLVERMMEDACV